MSIKVKTERVPLGNIDLEEERYRLGPPPSPQGFEALTRTIARFGLLHPPILVNSQGRLVVVRGHDRLQALIQASAPRSVNAFLLKNDSEPAILEAGLAELLAKRRPTPTEAARFVALMAQHLSTDRVAANYLTMLGQETSPYRVKQLLEIAGLEEPLLAALHQGRLDEEAAGGLTRFPFADRLILFEVIEQCGLSRNNQRKLLESVSAITRREGITVRTLIQEESVRAILDQDPPNPPQQATALMRLLRRRLLPRLSEAEEEFHRFKERLRLPRGVDILPSRSFEDDRVHLTVSFEDRRELETRINAVLTAAGCGRKKSS